MRLHIIAFDIPYPPDYGGVIDIFYKVKALHAAGCKIWLHCFAYGRKRSLQLEEYCEQVWYYDRKTGLAGVSMMVPYIVYSRRSEELLARLVSLDAPILFEGIQTTYYVSHPALADRRKLVRVHNIESQYTAQLATKQAPLVKKIYFNAEQRLLAAYEQRLGAATVFCALSTYDSAHFKALYPRSIHHYVPPFHASEAVTSRTGRGAYCLYHGNLSHPENVEAVLFLTQQVFASLAIPLVIAGMKPAKAVIEACASLAHCTLVADPEGSAMDELIANAQVIALPTFQRSGVKLKLLSSLFAGRHVVVNDDMLFGTGVESIYSPVARNAEEFRQLIFDAFDKDFTTSDIESRKKICDFFSNSQGAKRLKELLFL